MILEKFASPVEIATERFVLRPVRKSDAGLFALAFPEYTDFSSHVLQKRLEYIAQQRFSPRDLDRAWGLLSLGYEFGDQDLASGRNR